MIEISDVKFAYLKSSMNVLNGVSFTCETGTVNTILGLNGCGKTTLIKVIAGLIKPDNGYIYYRGTDLLSLNIHNRSKLIAYVPQHSSSVNDFTVSDYLLFGTVNSLDFYQRPNMEQTEYANAVADRFGISNMLSNKLGELSGGERQIVSICSAFIQNTEIILLDEPMSALDMKNQRTVIHLLKEIASEEHKTVILSTHNPNHALHLGGKTILMKDGMILMSGLSEYIDTVENLKEIYGDNICYSNETGKNEISFK